MPSLMRVGGTASMEWLFLVPASAMNLAHVDWGRLYSSRNHAVVDYSERWRIIGNALALQQMKTSFILSSTA